LLGGEHIVAISIAQLGNISDLTLFRSNRQNLNAKQTFLGDKAYIGEEFITTPYQNLIRSPKRLKFQRFKNKKISSRRIGIENLICRVKTFRVASDRFRLDRHRYNQLIMEGKRTLFIS
jgi:hypothetical protein